MFFKVKIRTNTQLKRSSKRLFGFYAALSIRELENSFFDVTNRLFIYIMMFLTIIELRELLTITIFSRKNEFRISRIPFTIRFFFDEKKIDKQDPL